MAESEDHELVKWFRDFQDESRPTEEALRQRFVHMGDEQRTKELQSLSSWLRDDSSLRVKAQIMKLGQDLNRLHTAMRKIGR